MTGASSSSLSLSLEGPEDELKDVKSGVGRRWGGVEGKEGREGGMRSEEDEKESTNTTCTLYMYKA